MAREKDEIEEERFSESPIDGWSKGKEFYKLLITRTSGEGRQVVLGVRNDNAERHGGGLRNTLNPTTP